MVACAPPTRLSEAYVLMYVREECMYSLIGTDVVYLWLLIPYRGLELMIRSIVSRDDVV